MRIEHGGELRKFSGTLPPGARVAVEAGGGWYWFVDELEQAGLKPHLVMLGAGTLPEVWIPLAGLRDLRGLLRTRLSLRRQSTFLKNRIHAVFAVTVCGMMRSGICLPKQPTAP